MSDVLRITGIASGIDTDATVKKLIEVEQIKVDKAEQEKQYLEWQKEDYREVANLLRGFQDEYFDALNPDKNLSSSKTFNLFSGISSNSSVVDVVASANSIAGDITIDSITQLATADTYKSASEVLGNLTSGAMSDIGSINSQIDIENTITFSFDGVEKEIELDQNDYADYNAFAADLTSKLQDEFTNSDIEVVAIGNQLEFNIYQKGTTTEETGHVLSVATAHEDLLNLMQLREGQSNSVDLNSSLAEVFGRSGDTSITINDVDFTFSDSDSIKVIMSEINSSTANVVLSYDSFSDGFTLTSTTPGTDSSIDITDTDGLFSDFNLQGGGEVHTAAQNAIFEANGVTTTRSDNTFEINGSDITLKGITTEAITISLESDTENTKELIRNFVSDYNKMISTINEMTSSSKNYDYKPLTESQKSDMTDDEIEQWEEKAREGTLSGDRTVRDITLAFREVLNQSVEGLGISLYDIGITTSTNYRERGNLVINESRLDAALEERPNEVIELFTKTSSYSYSDAENRGLRDAENGLAARLADVIKDNIRTSHDSNGEKGYLIEKAGDSFGVDSSSDFAKKIKEMDRKIEDLLIMLGEKEETYYGQFARMETALQRMNDQSSWLTSQMGG